MELKKSLFLEPLQRRIKRKPFSKDIRQSSDSEYEISHNFTKVMNVFTAHIIVLV